LVKEETIPSVVTITSSCAGSTVYRSSGSGIAAPYYKVPEYDPRSAIWIDVQKAHATIEAARPACRPGARCRVMAITERGRRPLPDPA